MANTMPFPLASIEEELVSALSDDEESLFSIDFDFIHNNEPNTTYKREAEEDGSSREVSCYHVAVSHKTDSSMDAFLWTLKHATVDQSSSASTRIVLIHVYPPMRFIPSPLGMLPKSKVSPKMVDKYMALERARRAKLLDIYVHAACSTAKVKVDVMLVESDTVAKAIQDLILTQNITTLAVGTTKPTMRKLMSKKGSGIASHILRIEPETSCKIKIICKGKEVMRDEYQTMITSSTSSSRSSNANSLSTQEDDDHQEQAISPDAKDWPQRPAVKSVLSGFQDKAYGGLSLYGYKIMWRAKLKPT